MKIPTLTNAQAISGGGRIPDAKTAAAEFEAFLVSEIWKQGQRGPRFSKLLDGGSTTQMTREMWIEEAVTQAVRTRGLGLARQLTSQLEGPKGERR